MVRGLAFPLRAFLFLVTGFVVCSEIRIVDRAFCSGSEIVGTAFAYTCLDESVDRGALNEAPSTATARAEYRTAYNAIFLDELVDEGRAKPGIFCRVSDSEPGGL